MKHARLVWKNLTRNKRRSILTVLSVGVALFLFAALQSVLTALDASTEVGSESRLITRNATGITFPLPEAYTQRLRAVDGVQSVSWANWFGGTYIDSRNYFAQFAVDMETFFPMYPEIEVDPAQLEAFKGEKSATIVGQGLMERFGWSLGQTLVLQGTIFPGDWEFVIRGVYDPDNPSFGDESMYFHYDYLYENSGEAATPGWFIVQPSDPSLATEVAQRIDDSFENSTAPTQTETEKAFQAGFVTMWGNVAFLVRAIGTAVFFAILLVAANTMMMSSRERISEVAVLKTLGYRDGLLSRLVVAESLAISVVGGIIGLAAAVVILSNNSSLGSILPGYTVLPSTMLQGLAIAIVLGLISGLVPARRAARLSVVDALRRVA
jgi:putative ABC transport system permease protein